MLTCYIGNQEYGPACMLQRGLGAVSTARGIRDMPELQGVGQYFCIGIKAWSVPHQPGGKTTAAF